MWLLSRLGCWRKELRTCSFPSQHLTAPFKWRFVIGLDFGCWVGLEGNLTAVGDLLCDWELERAAVGEVFLVRELLCGWSGVDCPTKALCTLVEAFHHRVGSRSLVTSGWRRSESPLTIWMIEGKKTFLDDYFLGIFEELFRFWCVEHISSFSRLLLRGLWRRLGRSCLLLGCCCITREVFQHSEY